jgi:DNA-directed RNA polymerase subunit N (RpoN/RPB10)
MTISCACVSKRFARFRHKLPIITCGMQGQFEDPKGIHIADFAICKYCCKRGVIGSPATHDELSDPARSIKRSIRCLRRKSLVNMVMPIQDNVNIIIVESLPNRLSIGIGTPA